jgi:hypothetical protein
MGQWLETMTRGGARPSCPESETRVLAVWHFPAVPAAAADPTECRRSGEIVLRSLAACPGYRRGQLGQAVDEPGRWVLVTEWDGVGSYRRALSAYDVKLDTAALPVLLLDPPSAFDIVAADDPATASLDTPLA